MPATFASSEPQPGALPRMQAFAVAPTMGRSAASRSRVARRSPYAGMARIKSWGSLTEVSLSVLERTPSRASQPNRHSDPQRPTGKRAEGPFLLELSANDCVGDQRPWSPEEQRRSIKSQPAEKAAMPGAMVKRLFECLKCGSDELEAVSDGELTNFLRPVCWSRWHVELGGVYRADPSSCPGCQHLDECLSRLTASS